MKTSDELAREKKLIETMGKFVDLTENERIKRKDYLYNKLYQFLTIDLTVFPIVSAIIFLFFEARLASESHLFVILAFLSYFIAVFYKFVVILRKLESSLTPTDALDDLDEDEWETEIRNTRIDNVNDLDVFNEKLIKWISHSICFSMCSIIISLTVIFQTYISDIMPEWRGFIFIILFLFNFVTLVLSVFYKGLFLKSVKISIIKTWGVIKQVFLAFILALIIVLFLPFLFITGFRFFSYL